MSHGHGQSTIKAFWQGQNAAGWEVFLHLSSLGSAPVHWPSPDQKRLGPGSANKRMAQRANRLSEPNFLSAPEIPGTEIGAHPLLNYVSFLLQNNSKLHKNLFIWDPALFVSLFDDRLQAGNPSVPELNHHGPIRLVARAEVPQKPEQLLRNLNVITIGSNNLILLHALLK
jgi:hypothetical protein